MSRKRIIGGTVGAAIGFFLGGGPLGAIQGFMQGYLIGAAFEDTQLQPGPRLSDLNQNDSSYGVVIPRVYGLEQVTANIIWMKNNALDEVAVEEVVQEGLFSDVTQTNYKYFASFAVALCEGKIDNVTKIWANDVLIYDAGTSYGSSAGSFVRKTKGTLKGLTSISEIQQDFSGALASGLETVEEFKAISRNGINFRIYKGSLTQEPDPLLIANLGEDTPAFRGVAYVVFDNLALTNESFRNSIPTLRFEVNKPDSRALDEIDDKEDVRTFIAAYKPERVDGTYSTDTVNSLAVGIRGPGSVITSAQRTTNIEARAATVIRASYAYSNGILYDMTYIRSANTYPSNITKHAKTYNIIYSFIDGSGVTSSSNLNLFPYLFQTHDLVNLQANTITSPANSDSKINSNLVSESQVVLFPFDMQDTTVVAQQLSVAPVVKPIDNLPNWVCVFRNNSLQVGFVTGDRFVLFDTGLNLNSEFTDGNSPYSFDINIGSFFSVSNASESGWDGNYHCVMLGGLVYVYCSPTTSLVRNYFPGVIRIDISGLEDTLPVDAIKIPANSIVSTQGASYIQNTTNDTYEVFWSSNKARRVLDNERILWDKDWMFTHLAYDYEANRLFGLFQANRPDNSLPLVSGKISSTYTSNPIILDQNGYQVYELNRVSLGTQGARQTLNDIPVGFISDKYTTVTGTSAYNSSITCLRVYDIELIDFGHGLYPIGKTIEDNHYYETGGNSQVTENIPSSSFSETGTSVTLYTNNTVASTFIRNILPDFSVSGSERSNILAGNTIGSSPAIISNRNIGATAIQKNVVTLAGNVQNLFNQSPQVEIGEVLAAELQRPGTIDVNTETNFADLTTAINGISIKDRGPITSTLKALQDGYLFDIYESDYEITSSLRETASVRRTLPAADLGAGERNPEPEFKITTTDKGQIPSQYYLTYRSKELDYDVSTVIWQDPTTSGNITLDMKVPMVLTAQQGYNLMRRVALATISSRQGSVEFSTSFKHSDLELSDFVTVILSDGKQYTLRITQIDKGRPGIVKIKGIIDNPINYTYEVDGVTGEVLSVDDRSQIATPLVIDSIPFKASDDGFGYFIGAYSIGSDRIFSSISSVLNRASKVPFSQGKVIYNTTPVGFCITALPNLYTEGDFDYTSSLTFNVLAFPNGFETLTEAEVLADQTTNTYFYGSEKSWEIIKILNFTTNANGTVTATGILRGYKGTKHFDEHVIGNYLIGANTNSLVKLGMSQENSTQNGVLFLADPSPEPNTRIFKTAGDHSRKPQPPIKLAATLQANGDFLLEWVRQARYGIEWVDGADVQLDEEIEEYRLYLLDPLDDNLVLDTITIDDGTSSYTLTVADQTAIYGGPVTEVTFATAQFSRELDDVGFISDILTT